MGGGGGSIFGESPSPSLVWAPARGGYAFPHLQEGLIVRGSPGHCVWEGASLAGLAFVINCSPALIGWMRRRLPGPRDTEVCGATFPHGVTVCLGFGAKVCPPSQDDALRDLPGCVLFPSPAHPSLGLLTHFCQDTEGTN